MVNNSLHLVEAHFPVDVRWLPLTQEYVKAYALAEGFNEVLTDMLTASIDEACGTLFKRAAEIDYEGRFELGLDADADSVSVEITYDGVIPLNPMKEKSYHVPDSTEELLSVDTNSLWLHLLKYQMDRISFTVNDKRQTLHMVKYRRANGREREVWVMSRKPRLQPHLIMEEGSIPDAHGMVGYVQDYKRGTVLRLGRAEMHALRMMNGETTVYDIYMQAVEEGLRVSPRTYTRLYEALESNGMLLRDEDVVKKRQSVLNRWLSRVTDLSATIPQPDRVVEYFLRAMRFFFTPLGCAFVIVLGFSGFYPLVVSSARMLDTYHHVVDIVQNDWWVLFCVYIFQTIATLFHELSHGAACKLYGGRIPRLGVMVYLSSLIFYCDVTSCYNFHSKRQRIMVSLAGPLCSFMIWGASLWGFYFSTSPAWQFFWLFNVISLTFGLFMNFNPFIRMDSYYILSEWLGINNLRSKSFGLMDLMIKRKMGQKVTIPTYTRSELNALRAYSVMGSLVTLLFLVIPFVRYVFYLLGEGNVYVKIVWGAFLLLIVCCNFIPSIYQKVRSLKYNNYRLQ